jgi:hypothetical protein
MILLSVEQVSLITDDERSRILGDPGSYGGHDDFGLADHFPPNRPTDAQTTRERSDRLAASISHEDWPSSYAGLLFIGRDPCFFATDCRKWAVLSLDFALDHAREIANENGRILLRMRHAVRPMCRR